MTASYTLLLAAADATLLDDVQQISPATMHAGIEEFKRQFDLPRKAFVVGFTGRDLPGLLTYLAALELGHAVLLKENPTVKLRETLLGTYLPDFVVDTGSTPVPACYQVRGWCCGARVLVRSSPTEPDIHPELGLLVATSGSLGQPKLVRLSYANVSANAHSIVDALGIGHTDVGITSLPIDYSFGLSVVNMHLVAGASLVLSPWSPTSRRFWKLFGKAAATNVGAVPVTYRLLHSIKWQASEYPALRLGYQAGGALEPEMTAYFGHQLLGNGGGFCSMYGATEATARISCLAPTLLFEHLGSVGRPVPGGQVWLADPDERGVGEIVYRGPNVMMGYARSRADLASGDTTGDVLYTGDLGYLERDMLYVVGRKDRQVKLHGKLVSLDDIEKRLASVGPAIVVPARGDAAIVFVEGSSEPFRRVWGETLRALELPVECLPLQSVDSLPRTSSGKLDLSSLQTLASKVIPE